MGQNNQPLHLRTIKVDGDALLLQIEEAEHKKEKDRGEGLGLLILKVPHKKGKIMNRNGKQSAILTQRGFDEISGGIRRKEAETILVQEVEELRGRAVQMEKTMRSVLTVFPRSVICFRWWRECAANWREKWTKVRLERNKLVEEAREMRIEAGRMEKERDRVSGYLRNVQQWHICPRASRHL